ncbi:hypothetical protein RB653_007389 [Dictyostelium firmibasis]|uniref:Farnesyl diphosphate synthase n=1 Tax=Dictyostelium firmibasis TaxID=79012 RepID=A0AAN7TVJ4_9MYCE
MNLSFNFEEERDQFLKVYPMLKQDILNELPKMKLPNNVINYISSLLNSSVLIGGKMTRGLGFINSFNFLFSNNINNNNLEITKFEGRIIGWCLEFLSFFLVTDDIIDNGLTRRGELCWYLNPSPFNPTENKVGMLAINDSVLIESFLFLILKKYLKEKSMYVEILEIFQECIYHTAIGQLFDASYFHQKRGDFTNFNYENYSQICINKTSYYMFIPSIKLAILLTKNKMKIENNDTNKKTIKEEEEEEEEEEELVKSICFDLGVMFQAKDDYLDCFGDPIFVGKTGTDIQENKCCWLICKAITLVDDNQLNQLKQNYGINNDLSVSKVKSIYNEINLPDHYQKYENEQFNLISEKLQKLSETSIQKSEILLFLLKKIFKRNK